MAWPEVTDRQAKDALACPPTATAPPVSLREDRWRDGAEDESTNEPERGRATSAFEKKKAAKANARETRGGGGGLIGRIQRRPPSTAALGCPLSYSHDHSYLKILFKAVARLGNANFVCTGYRRLPGTRMKGDTTRFNPPPYRCRQGTNTAA